MTDVDFAPVFQEAAQAIAEADALLVGAGAGMGVDSGLPDFRGPEGFWKAYPPFRGKQFHEISNPRWFREDPEMAWGFFGHRLNLYRDAEPHAGFALLKQWAEAKPAGYFVFTSNVDGQFQKAGFPEERVFECHGSICHLQCAAPCQDKIWPARDLQVEVDLEAVRATSELPRCPECGALARPNVLMFDDWKWKENRSQQQQERYLRWLYQMEGSAKVVSIEMGAGRAIPTVRNECEKRGHTLIRINPRDCDAPSHGIPLPVGALAALQGIDQRLV